MNDTARRYHCTLCHTPTTICRHCDRGNIYCTECAPKARKGAARRAAVKYQNTPQGRLNHATRQRAYRERLKLKVTHKGCVIKISDVRPVVKLAQVFTRKTPSTLNTADTIYCDICCNLCSNFLRRSFLQRSA